MKREDEELTQRVKLLVILHYVIKPKDFTGPKVISAHPMEPLVFHVQIEEIHFSS